VKSSDKMVAMRAPWA